MNNTTLNSRQEKMKEYLKINKNVNIHQLIEYFNVSDMTIRRDLQVLEQLGYVKKIHGGAIFQEQVKEDLWLAEREKSNNREKERIAEFAITLIPEGSTILLDAGTTTHWIAKKLLTRKNITVVTNALNIANLLSANTSIEIVLPGGDVRHSTQSLVGPAAEKFIRTLRVDYAFIGCGGISIKHGLMNSNMIEGEVKQAMMRSAKNICLVVDYTKFTETNPFIFASLDEIHMLITNKELNESSKARLTELTHLDVRYV